MLANRYPEVRAAVFYGGDPNLPTLTRQHNNSNVLSIGARFVNQDLAKQVIWDWLHTPAFLEEKYHRRNQKIEVITKQLWS
jgi:ribose 5-phosphate isomerase B